MKYIVRETASTVEFAMTALGKARVDIEKVATRCGYEILIIPMLDLSIAQSHSTHIKVYQNWKKNFPKLKKGDELLLQLPLLQHSLFFPNMLRKIKRRGVRVYGFIHDLDMLRVPTNRKDLIKERIRKQLEERRALELCDAIIVHNRTMKNTLSEFGYSKEKIINLEIFDYLSSTLVKDRTFDKTVIIAGNLARTKSAYIYKLPDKVKFNLYGIAYNGIQNDYIKYHGSFLSDELPKVVEGSFGLVWDGESVDTCTGAYGQYLKINNPHKTSFYLSCGIPILIWEEAALAGFAKEHNCGIPIKSLQDIPDILNKMTDEEYKKLKDCTAEVAVQLQQGFYAQKAICEAEHVSII